MSLEVDIEKKFKGFNLQARFSAGDETLGLLGASGCGKSLTMRSIAGIERPDSGKIVVNGTVFFDRAPGKKARVDLSPQQRKTALLFQNYMLFPNLTVAQNVAAGIAKDVSPADRDAMVQAELKRFGLSGFEKRYPAQLSGGQQQRCAIARAIAVKPSLILADEPTGNLDKKTGREILQIFRELHQAGNTIVLITHDPKVAQSAERVIRIEDGQLYENQEVPQDDLPVV